MVHAYSARKHNKYIAVNCGAIPEGTIDSELFRPRKGVLSRGRWRPARGYFEEANGGTIFLDEVAELPHPTQARLLRVLPADGREFIRVGSSKVQKTDVRVVAATNTDLMQAIARGLRFREDLYYRPQYGARGSQPIALRERPGDITPLLFRKFASDVAARYRMPVVSLDPAAREMLSMNYYWRGNIRQLKNVAEQISAIETSRTITPEVLSRYLPPQEQAAASACPRPWGLSCRRGRGFLHRAELLYKVLFDMRADINELRRMLSELMQGASHREPAPAPAHMTSRHCCSATATAATAAEYAEGEVVSDDAPQTKSRPATRADHASFAPPQRPASRGCGRTVHVRTYPSPEDSGARNRR